MILISGSGRSFSSLLDEFLQFVVGGLGHGNLRRFDVRGLQLLETIVDDARTIVH